MLQGPPGVLSSGHRCVLLQEYYLQDHELFTAMSSAELHGVVSTSEERNSCN